MARFRSGEVSPPQKVEEIICMILTGTSIVGWSVDLSQRDGYVKIEA